MVIRVLLLAQLMGCDTLGMINIQNKTDSDVGILIGIRKEAAKYSDSIMVEIKSGETGHLNYGLGMRWTNPVLKSYAENIVDTIHLQVGAQNYFCSSTYCKNELFNRKNRKFMNLLEIRLDSVLIQKLFVVK